MKRLRIKKHLLRSACLSRINMVSDQTITNSTANKQCHNQYAFQITLLVLLWCCHNNGFSYKSLQTLFPYKAEPNLTNSAQEGWKLQLEQPDPNTTPRQGSFTTASFKTKTCEDPGRPTSYLSRGFVPILRLLCVFPPNMLLFVMLTLVVAMLP